MQSLLVDINTAAITYRRECLQSLDKKKYAHCFGCIKAMNGLLPEDQDDKSYRIRIDTAEYNEKVKGSSVARCNYCKKDTERKGLQILNIRLPAEAAQVIGYDVEQVWLCSHCKKDNILKDTVIIQNVVVEPFYSQIVPEPPKREVGLLNQMDYHKNVVEWVWLCLDNLEEAFTRYRKDYEPKANQMGLFESDVNTELEESEQL